ncbi:hypothetical protein CC1G_08050 [Coprinopsis cinerea okayama7|uniref:Uncharacterized protein n=1 Tax=Coprinopsis cinerea (strain Okayama-7 / 130 / ATCC MYA-4618 / FGSC 9003) TaxID=240176 RepID=A8NQE9_COPC7|nr:hypothetical protein CC1G_08050 [Coprinopsis cinerea okayama7\|eukprot:XP_001835541.2 hypothetical protein CC1G_08050 [Coprinopsis cinerea okayama7\
MQQEGAMGCTAAVPTWKKEDAARGSQETRWAVDLRCQNANASATAIGDGSICVSTPDTPEAVNFNSAKWTTSALQARSDEAHHNHACAEPDVVGFKTPDGKKHLIKVPEGHGQLEYISQLLEAEDYAALTSYEHVE